MVWKFRGYDAVGSKGYVNGTRGLGSRNFSRDENEIEMVMGLWLNVLPLRLIAT
jgi:hypothetical protein